MVLFMFDQKGFGARLKEARKATNVSQEKLAELSGISVQTISSYETGHSAPVLENINDICVILNVSLDYLVYGEEHSRKLMNDEKIDDAKEFIKKLLNLIDTGYAELRIQDSPFLEKSFSLYVRDEHLVSIIEDIKKYVDDRNKLDPSTYRFLIDSLLNSNNFHF